MQPFFSKIKQKTLVIQIKWLVNVESLNTKMLVTYLNMIPLLNSNIYIHTSVSLEYI